MGIGLAIWEWSSSSFLTMHCGKPSYITDICIGHDGTGICGGIIVGDSAGPNVGGMGQINYVGTYLNKAMLALIFIYIV